MRLSSWTRPYCACAATANGKRQRINVVVLNRVSKTERYLETVNTEACLGLLVCRVRTCVYFLFDTVDGSRYYRKKISWVETNRISFIFHIFRIKSPQWGSNRISSSNISIVDIKKLSLLITSTINTSVYKTINHIDHMETNTSCLLTSVTMRLKIVDVINK